MRFHPALGDPEGLHERERGLFESEGFSVAPAHCEGPNQSFTSFLESEPPYPDEVKHVCYLQVLPAAGFTPIFVPLVTELIETFFGLPVRTHRFSHTQPTQKIQSGRGQAAGKARQLWASEVCSDMHQALPVDAYCAVSLTFVDLYPETSMSFVFAHRAEPPADLFSYFRSETFEHGIFPPHVWPACVRVLAHDLCHLLGLSHCCYFRCLMNPMPNGSRSDTTSLATSAERTLNLCPVCLRKLAYACSLDVRTRYQKLTGLLERLGFEHEPQWIRDRLSKTPGAFPIEWSP